MITTQLVEYQFNKKIKKYLQNSDENKNITAQ